MIEPECAAAAARAWLLAGDFSGLEEETGKTSECASQLAAAGVRLPPEGYFEVLLALYCVMVVKLTASLMTEEMHKKQFVKSIVTACMAGYGGSLINPALLGTVAPPIANPKLVSAMVIAWFLYHNMFAGAAWRRLVNVWAVEVASKVAFEIFRAWVIFSWYTKALHVLTPLGGAWLGPVICGTLGGSGGSFLPHDKGLKPLDDGAPWTMESAFYVVMVYHSFRDAEPLVKADLHAGLCLALVIARLFPSFTEALLSPCRLLARVTFGIAPRKLKED